MEIAPEWYRQQKNLQRFDAAIRNIWGETPLHGKRSLGKGAIISGMTQVNPKTNVRHEK